MLDLVHPPTTVDYDRGAMATFTYVKDNIKLLSDATRSIILKGFQFGVASTTSNMFAGVLGLGYGKAMGLGHDSFLDALFALNQTSTRIFSMALGNGENKNDTGSLVFGGLDRRKFAGRLTSVPIHFRSGFGYSIKMTQLSWNYANHKVVTSKAFYNTAGPVFLNAMEPRCFLPQPVVNEIVKMVGAASNNRSYHEETDPKPPYVVDCSWKAANGSFRFAFENGLVVEVPIGEFIWTIRDGPMCLLGIEPSLAPRGRWVLGSMFLRNVYVVFDQKDNLVSMAKYVDCGKEEVFLTRWNMLDGIDGTMGRCSEDRGIPGSNDTALLKPYGAGSGTTTAYTTVSTRTGSPPGNGSIPWWISGSEGRFDIRASGNIVFWMGVLSSVLVLR